MCAGQPFLIAGRHGSANLALHGIRRWKKSFTDSTSFFWDCDFGGGWFSSVSYRKGFWASPHIGDEKNSRGNCWGYSLQCCLLVLAFLFSRHWADVKQISVCLDCFLPPRSCDHTAWQYFPTPASLDFISMKSALVLFEAFTLSWCGAGNWGRSFASVGKPICGVRMRQGRKIWWHCPCTWGFRVYTSTASLMAGRSVLYRLHTAFTLFTTAVFCTVILSPELFGSLSLHGQCLFLLFSEGFFIVSLYIGKVLTLLFLSHLSV